MHNILEWLWVLKNVFLAVGAVAIVFYTLWYFLLANWRKYPAGRSVLGFTTSLVAVLGYTLLALFDGDSFINFPITDPSAVRVIIGVIVYGSVAYTSVQLDVTLIRSWHRGEVPHPAQNPFIPEEKTDRRIRRAAKR